MATDSFKEQFVKDKVGGWVQDLNQKTLYL